MTLRFALRIASTYPSMPDTINKKVSVGRNVYEKQSW